ncbi:MAG TPA: threonylcarbamoyl-AMP synthase [Lachnospiraceae bacterium]|nr:threonylcarbamoyl-AMP synthase [Lachnospiraceae bacterium]
METLIRKIDNLNIDSEIIKEAAGILQRGGLVAFPTETVYGLGANGLSEEACKKIYEAKGRPSDNPLILHIGDFAQLEQIVEEVPALAKKVMDAFWPGPLTLIFKKKPCVPNSVTGGLDTVGVRFPSNMVARELIRESKLPIAAPSANSSGKPSPTKASHVKFDLDGKVEMIIDGGSTDFGLESTIVDVTGDVAVILRPGAITKEMLVDLLGYAEVDPAILARGTSNAVPKAPGMKYTHYSPKAQVILVKGETSVVVEKINSLVAENQAKGLKVGVMATDETKDRYKADIVLSVGARNDEIAIGASLFKILRKFDFFAADIVYSEVFAETGEGLAIMNRLNKAAGYNYIEV